MMLTLLALIPSSWKLIGVVVVVVAALGGFLAYEHHKLVTQGEAIELQKIEDANAAERKKAAEGSDAVDSCVDIGRDWDRLDGVCRDAPR